MTCPFFTQSPSRTFRSVMRPAILNERSTSVSSRFPETRIRLLSLAWASRHHQIPPPMAAINMMMGNIFFIDLDTPRCSLSPSPDPDEPDCSCKARRWNYPGRGRAWSAHRSPPRNSRPRLHIASAPAPVRFPTMPALRGPSPPGSQPMQCCQARASRPDPPAVSRRACGSLPAAIATGFPRAARLSVRHRIQGLSGKVILDRVRVGSAPMISGPIVP